MVAKAQRIRTRRRDLDGLPADAAAAASRSGATRTARRLTAEETKPLLGSSRAPRMEGSGPNGVERSGRPYSPLQHFNFVKWLRVGEKAC